MPILFARPDSNSSIESLRKLLFEGNLQIQSAPHSSNRSGNNTGKLLGGNLSLIIDSLGTSSEPDTNNSILVLEEIDEYFYRVDRMMTQLKRAGKLQGLKGLIVGHMTDIKESELPFKESIEEIILNAVKEYNYPVAFGFPTGHENPNYAWPVGCQAELAVDTRGASLQSKYFARA
jgi:muramoyltetrapeptide carboxypeptidase